MRIYTEPMIAFKEVERDLWEMGIDVHPQTMQNKDVANDPKYMTKEVRSYGFNIVSSKWTIMLEKLAVSYVMIPPGKDPDLYSARMESVLNYIEQEFRDRISGIAMNPGNSYIYRLDVWNEFLVNNRFHYTYSERIAPQLMRVKHELANHPETRQAIINIHSNIADPSIYRLYNKDDPNRHRDASIGTPRDNSYGGKHIYPSMDMQSMGGSGRVPCSMYYQMMIRENKLDLIYTMRSCDFLVHFPVDVMLALRLQKYMASQLSREIGTFTYFTGSLHAYRKDMEERGIF